MRRSLIPALVPALAAALLSVSCQSPISPAEQDRELTRLAGWMTGSFSSAAQAEQDPENYFDIRLEMARIWTDRRDGYWFYVEQAAASALERPYRQRVYKLTRGRGETFVSEVFTLPGDPLVYAGAWRDPSMLDAVTPEELAPREGCAITMRSGYHREYRMDGDELEKLSVLSFVGSTRGDACVSTLRGASFATSEVEIEADGMRTWDRGYDASGNQVWGATEGPYVFDRVGR